LNELPIGESQLRVGLVSVVSCVGPDPWKGNGELSFPAGPVEVFKMCGQGQCLGTPVRKAEESANADASEASGIGPLRAVETPVKILFWACCMKLLVCCPVIGFLIYNQSLCATVYQFRILLVLHRTYFDSEGRDGRGKAFKTLLKVAL
jgi:hypothetical protein